MSTIKTITLKGQTFTTHLTNSEALLQLNTAVEDGTITGSFAWSLLRQYRERGRLSERQWPWVQKLVHDYVTHPHASREPAPVVAEDWDELIAVFDTASAHKKYPKLTFEFEDGRVVVLRKAGPRSKYAGSINVTDDGKYPDNLWYGRINPDGTFTARRVRTGGGDEEVLEFLRRFAKNPAEMAIEYGKRSGRCCFCGKALKHGELGYGPVCAKNWGLPWTRTAAADDRKVEKVETVAFV